jgi:uncharacterized protein
MEKLIAQLAAELKLNPAYVQNVVALIDEGNTIPFIARYRKELHGSMDDTQLRDLADRLQYLRNMDKRREEILASIESQGKLTDELRAAISAAVTLAKLEDIYRPYKQKRRTRATIAREKGLEPLAQLLFAQELREGSLEEIAAQYISDGGGDEKLAVATAADALAGASDIIAEEISDNAKIRDLLREQINKYALLVSKAADKEPADTVYRLYYDFSETLPNLQSHRVLAINRGEKEKILSVSIDANDAECLKIIRKQVVKHGSISSDFVSKAAEDSYERLIFPSVEREARTTLTDMAAEQAIKMFGLNLKPTLMQPPVKNMPTMGFDPAYRTGCKIAVVDENGKLLETGVVYPTMPHNKTAEAIRTLTRMIKQHKVKAIAIGNGTASKESEIFVAEMLRSPDLADVAYMVVNEAGASVYSASKLAASEFPELDVSLRSAVSIARRLQDPLAELVKIDPKSIGVGQYQHDMPPARLDETLTGVVEDCVNSVGVDINSASPALLSYVSGLNATTAANVVAYREENGAYKTRAQIKKVPKVGPKAFEQCAGFLRIPESKNLLDNTGVHPESYKVAEKILESGLDTVNAAEVAKELGVGVPTVQDIIKELHKPGRDPRDELPPTMLRTDVMDMKDLKAGMKLKGTVRNVIDFGAFIDIGVHQDGLVHVSEIANKFVKHPSEAVKVGDIVDVVVLSVDTGKKRISLSIKQAGR